MRILCREVCLQLSAANPRGFPIAMCADTRHLHSQVSNISRDTIMTQCWFPGLVISTRERKSKIIINGTIIFFLKLYNPHFGNFKP